MPQFKQIDTDYLVAGQIDQSDIDQAVSDGVRMIVSCRPDGEEPGQPDAAQMARWSEQKGVAFHHIPFVAGQLSMELVKEMRETLDQADGPVLGFCKSGGRAAALWAAAEALSGSRQPGELIAAAENAGYDIKSLRPALDRLSATGR